MYSKVVYIKLLLFLSVAASLFIAGCSSSSVGDDEDSTSGTISLTSLDSGEEVVGTYSITWANSEQNKSTVSILLSTDSGASFLNIIATKVPDTGTYSWDSNTVPDCRRCRVQITAFDIVGNVSAPDESATDFRINNVPQVLGTALYYDVGNDGPGDLDTIVVPFDKQLELTTGIASDIFIFPVLGDDIGSFAEVKKDPADASRLIITMNNVVPGANNRLHVKGQFNPNKLFRTAPSGLNLRDDIGAGVIFARDTGRTAEVAENGVDIAPAFTDSNQPLGVNNTFAVALGDIDGDGDLDMVSGNFFQANRVWRNNGGVFREDGPAQMLGTYQTAAVALGDIDGDGDLDMVTGNDGINRVWINNDPGNPGVGVFTDSTQTLGTSTTQDIALGDIDGDGDLDMVTGNFNQPNRVWLNGGDNSGSNTGLFAEVATPQTLGNNSTIAVALGDVDGDGDLDLVTANKKQPSLVWLNGGDNSGSNTGVFSDSGQVLDTPLSEGVDIELGDVDGDGDLDMVVGMVGESRLWINNINNLPGQEGVFTDSGQSLGIGFTNGISIGDIDNDGDLDLVLGRSVEFAGAPNRVLLNNINNIPGEEGKFTDSGQLLGDSISGAVNLGDVDGDGDLDLVVGNFGESNKVWLNSLKSPVTGLLIDSGQSMDGFMSDIALGDIDGDGDLDLVTGNSSAIGVRTNNFYNLGGQEGVFTDSGQSLDATASVIVLGDVDNDGDLDIVAAGNGANTVWLNGGDNSGSNTGVFSDSLQTLGNYFTFAIALGDIDGDGDLDLVTANISSGNRVWRNTGGIFAEDMPAQLLGTIDTRAIALGDIDGDGDLDIVLGRDQRPDSIWLNGGDNSGSNTGIFSDSGQTLGAYRTGDIALGDIDGDNDLDMVTANNYSSVNRIWRNDAGNLVNDITPTLMLAITESSTAAALGDIDNDGDLDLVIGNNGQANRLWMNNIYNTPGLDGVFSDSGLSMGTNDTSAIALGDVDNDGDLDMVTGNFFDNSRVWLNDY